MKTVEELERKMTEPSDDLVRAVSQLDGDLIILGVGGKMGPSLAMLAKNAIRAAGGKQRVIGVSRFSSGTLRSKLEAAGIETISADLLDDQQLQQLPKAENVIYMAGQKFGTTGREPYTWAMNAYLPGRVAEAFRHSRIVSYSTGNVYPLMPVKGGGATEETPVAPVGEYAQSCLGRERIFSYFSTVYNIPMLHFRLNYAIDMRYGVLLEVATAVRERQPIDLSMGHVNVIWQGDANEMAIRSLALCDTPPRILNVTGPETISVRWLAEQFAKRFGVDPIFVNEEQDTALLSNASEAHRLFGYPRVSLQQMIDWTVEWIEAGGEILNKATRFQERKGEF
ncbi:NAD(P)-dependent oxidoreductase [Brevibacillus sp. MCWH]|jgi:nucleoside-diphosphate-sugar epimerase|uniref:NAD-dependent epimerase/dehydratase family protein n=1 Tax=Brevibacillus sp. MCWH TaxID=2508871 RepID=UPI001490DB08|nr:NAD-dependent epimerase/dehydratase family protein [Brevibacillus sp. MCWH]NNV02905.1 NAD(P)-dependent oxidoreductase [Brevibacillus sp. MCWH]